MFLRADLFKDVAHSCPSLNPSTNSLSHRDMNVVIPDSFTTLCKSNVFYITPNTCKLYVLVVAKLISALFILLKICHHFCINKAVIEFEARKFKIGYVDHFEKFVIVLCHLKNIILATLFGFIIRFV